MLRVRTLEQQTARFITHECGLPPAGDEAGTLLVALSGGADSVALLRMLLRVGYRCAAAHCNFHLRGEESDRDETFVRNLCHQLDVPLHVTHFETKAYAGAQGISVEMAARELRYRWFDELLCEQGYACVAVAHHRDDSVETVLLNLIRGTGIRGLTGISPRNGHIIRPLLQTDRKSILEYLAVLEQPYVTDSTNLCDDYVRNSIRLNLLPMMERLNPSVRQSIAATASRLSQTAAIYEEAVSEAFGRICNPVDESISIPALLQERHPQTILYECLSRKGFNAAQVEQIYQCCLTGESGRRFRSDSHELVRDRDTLFLKAQGKERQEISSVEHIRMQTVDYTPGFIIPRDKTTACVDADLVKWPLTVRLWQQGDKFAPFGMAGKKKLVSDYLTDRKYTLHQKERQQVVCDAEGRIVWLVAERIDERFRVTARTRRVTLLQTE